MSLLKCVPFAVLLFAALLLLGGCAGNSCDPYAAYDNCCGASASYADCNGCCGRCVPCAQQRGNERMGRSLFY